MVKYSDDAVKKILSAFCLIFCLLSAYSIYSQVPEHQLKAVFIDRFISFTQWPESSFTNMNDISQSFIITIYGENPVYDVLKEIYKDRTIHSKKVVIYNVNHLRNISYSHIVFISHSSSRFAAQIIREWQNKPVLIISETDGLAEQGSMLNFIIQENLLKFEANAHAVRKSGLQMSYHLLQRAVRISNGNNGL